MPPEDLGDSVYGYPTLPLVSFTKPVLRMRQPWNYYDFALIANRQLTKITTFQYAASKKQVTDEKISFVHLWTECIVKNEQTATERFNDPTKKGPTSVSTVRLTERQTMRGKVSTTERITVEHWKRSYHFKDTTNVWMSGSAFYADYIGFAIRK